MSDVTAQLNDAGSLEGRTPPAQSAQVADTSVRTRAPWYSRPIQLIVVSGIILIAIVTAVTSSLLSNLRDRDIAEKTRTLESLALVLAEQIDRSFQAIELIQLSEIERMHGFDIKSSEDLELQMSSYDTHRRLQNRISALPHINAIVLTNAEGKLINFSRTWPIPSIKNTNPDVVEAFKSNPRLVSLVGNPVRSPTTGSWVVPIARKFAGANGEFLGVVTGVMELSYLEQIFGAVANAPNGSIGLFRRDGAMLVRYPRQEAAIGQSFAQSRTLKLLATSNHVAARDISVVDGQERLVAARNLAHYPVALIVTTTVTDALANWKRGAITMIGTALALGLLIGGIIVLCVWLVGKKLREQSLQRDTAFNNMSQGIGMFDDKQRLIVCNERYVALYGLTKEQTKPGTTLRAILEHRVTVGSVPEDHAKYIEGQLNEVAKNQPYQILNRLHDGRYISIVHTPMADGGWVATHEDVTEAKQREKSFRLLFDSNPVPMWVIDWESLHFLAINDAVVTHYGYSREQLMSMTALDLRPAEDRGQFAQLLRSESEDQLVENIVQHSKADGTIIDVCVYSRALVYAGHNARLVAIHDITQAKHAEDELRRTQGFVNTVIENMPLPITVKDTQDRRYILVNRACEEWFGVSRDNMIGKRACDLLPKEEADAMTALDNAALQSVQPPFADTYSLHTPHNEARLVTAKKVAIRDNDGNPIHLLTVIDDVTERRRSEQRIAHMAHYDNLTDLPNRAAFNECFAAILERAAANNEQFSILSVDLDHFKEVNDLFGHSIGDALLRKATRRLQATAGGAFVARIGGDEFMLIVADGAQPAAATALAERLLAAFTGDFEVDGRQLRIGLTIGGAIYPKDGADAKTLMINADTALYRAKADMRGSMLFFEPEMSARLGERLALQGDLRSAVARGELLLHYQPQVRMNGETTGFEALLRWQCPTRGMVSPATFIPIAEESGLIVPIGEWVLREACREAASWSQPLTIAVNVSPVQFHHCDLPSLVHSILLETGLAAARLELEVTEGILIDDFPRAVSILRRLKALGVQIALDDFGTGYSSLSYLHSFAFDRIKIDRAFIGDLEHNRHSMVIVRAVIGLGHSLNVPILAEGVETEIQQAILVQEGCDAMQGYLTGRPQPIADYAGLIGAQAAVRQKIMRAG